MDENLLQEIKKEYEKTIPAKIISLRQLIDALNHDWNKDNLMALRFHVHKIAGSAGTYGYQKASDLCRHLDQLSLEELGHFDPGQINNELLIQFDQSFEKIKQGFTSE